MESLTLSPLTPASLGPQPDYLSRALVLWPRLDRRFSRVRRDPNRMAAMIARRTNLSPEAILALLGAPDH
jgi:hypothetical protein